MKKKEKKKRILNIHIYIKTLQMNINKKPNKTDSPPPKAKQII